MENILRFGFISFKQRFVYGIFVISILFSLNTYAQNHLVKTIGSIYVAIQLNNANLLTPFIPSKLEINSYEKKLNLSSEKLKEAKSRYKGISKKTLESLMHVNKDALLDSVYLSSSDIANISVSLPKGIVSIDSIRESDFNNFVVILSISYKLKHYEISFELIRIKENLKLDGPIVWLGNIDKQKIDIIKE